MKTIIVNLSNETIPCVGSYKDDWGNTRKFNSFKVNYLSGQRVYITVLKDEMKLTTIAKKLEFENEAAFIKIGKDKIKIGTIQL